MSSSLSLRKLNRLGPWRSHRLRGRWRLHFHHSASMRNLGHGRSESVRLAEQKVEEELVNLAVLQSDFDTVIAGRGRCGHGRRRNLEGLGCECGVGGFCEGGAARDAEIHG